LYFQHQCSHFQRQCSHFHNIVCILNEFKNQNPFVFALPACPMIQCAWLGLNHEETNLIF
jgi:hypothetical protein